MSKVFMLQGAESEQILRAVIAKKIPAIMSYLSRDKWHVAKVQLTDLAANRLSVEGLGPRNKPRPINIQIDQPVGISFKHAYGKFVFDTTVLALEPSLDPTGPGQSGTIVIAAPDKIEVVQRRSYFRVNVPQSLHVNVTLWHRSQSRLENSKFEIRNSKFQPEAGDRSTVSRALNDAPQNYYQGKLVDISAGGVQVMIPQQRAAQPINEILPVSGCGCEARYGSCGSSLKKGQYVGIRFTPLPYEMPLMFDAQIRNILPAEDCKGIYLGLQIVGLEASPEGQQVLSRIAEVVERYYQLNLSSAKQLDMQSEVPLAPPSAGRGPDVEKVPSHCLFENGEPIRR